MRRRGLAIAWLALGTGCLQLEYSPHAATLDERESELHRKAKERLAASPPAEVLRVALVGDTQFAFDEARDVVAALNARGDLAFVVQLGDFTHTGVRFEFVEMNEIFARLRVPYFVVVGIHDLVGNGEAIYLRMFGPLDDAFTAGRTRFVLFDSNSLETGFDGTVPDLARLRRLTEPDGSFDRVVLMSHIAPHTADFDPALEEGYEALLRAQRSVVSFHAHEHGPREGEIAGTPLWVADAVEHRTYLLATIGPDGVRVERVPF